MIDKKWYEKPIKCHGLAWVGSTWRVENGEQQGNQLAERHYWPSHEEQQRDLMEVLDGR